MEIFQKSVGSYVGVLKSKKTKNHTMLTSFLRPTNLSANHKQIIMLLQLGLE